MDEKTKQALSLWDKLFQTYESIRKVQARTVFEHNLTAPQYNVLEVLYIFGPMPLKKISQKLFVSGANITCIVDNLEKESLVERVPSSGDRRIIQAELTEKGRAKMKSLFPLNAKNLMQITSVLNNQEQEELTKLLDKLDTNKTAA
ncbi:MAG: MarR family winged helix-turn-helix transcriptional regulator [Bacteroidota bacterium]